MDNSRCREINKNETDFETAVAPVKQQLNNQSFANPIPSATSNLQAHIGRDNVSQTAARRQRRSAPPASVVKWLCRSASPAPAPSRTAAASTPCSPLPRRSGIQPPLLNPPATSSAPLTSHLRSLLVEGCRCASARRRAMSGTTGETGFMILSS